MIGSFKSVAVAAKVLGLITADASEYTPSESGRFAFYGEIARRAHDAIAARALDEDQARGLSRLLEAARGADQRGQK